MLKVSANEILRLMASRRGTVLLILLTTCLLFATSRAETPECCSKNSTWLNHTRNCTDGLKIRLQCKEFWKFQPSIEVEENFRVTDDGNNTWLVLEHSADGHTYNVTADQFCVTKQNEEEVALICFPEDASPVMPKTWKIMFIGVFSMVSGAFLAFTLIVYLILPELRDLQDKAIISMTASFMVAFFANGNQSLNVPEDLNVCVSLAFVMYYAYLCAFFWLNIISFNIWRSVWLPSLKIPPNVLYLIYCFVGWGIPLCFFATSLVSHHSENFFFKPGFGKGSCWFYGSYVHWVYFYGPILTLLTLNMIYLGLTGYKLWLSYGASNGSNHKILRFKCWMFIKLSLLMGFTWIFEVISYASDDADRLYWLLTDILNVLQGVFIFIVLVVSRKRVRKLLAKKRPCNIPFPKAWAAYADQENSEEMGPEELVLSQS